MFPLMFINEWLEQEKKLGSPNPNNGVLATANKECTPHSRIVAIREITSDGVLFFTQRGSRKVSELNSNPYASMTIWLPLQQKEIIIDGNILALTSHENLTYWQTLPYDRQLKFSAYAPLSGQVISSLEVLEKQREKLQQQFSSEEIPFCEDYLGFRLVPQTVCLYTLGTETFSEVLRFTKNNEEWKKELISP